MPFITLSGGLFYPILDSEAGNIGTVNSMLLDSAGEAAASIIRISKSGTLTRVGYRTAAASVAGSMNIIIQTVDTSTGLPSGTIWSTAASAQINVTGGNDNQFFEVTLSSGAVITTGDLVALVFQNSDGTGTYNIGDAGKPASNNFPYTATFAGGIWNKRTNLPINSLYYSDSSYSYVEGVLPYVGGAQTVFNTNDANNERGNAISFPWPCQVGGMWFGVRVLSSDNSTFEARIYGADTSTVVASAVFAANLNPGFSQVNTFYVDFGYQVSLSANTIYHFTVLATGISDITLNEIICSSTELAKVYFGNPNIYTVIRSSGAAWTSATSSIGMIGPIVTGFDDGTGAGTGGGTTTIIGAGAWGFA